METNSTPIVAPHLVTSPAVWMESEATEQLARLATLPGCVQAVGLPDLHPGPGGMPIGAVSAFEDRLLPHLLGSDLGCGVRLCLTDQRRPSIDRLEREIDRALASDQEGLLADADESALRVIVDRGIRGLCELNEDTQLPSSLLELAQTEPESTPLAPCGSLAPPPLGREHLLTLGSIGGGNHFAEVAAVAELADPELARQFGITRNSLAVLVHCGSRSVGKTLADRWGHTSIPVAEATPYLLDHHRACQFARTNRFILAWRLLAAIGAARPKRIRHTIDAIHNGIAQETIGGRSLWLHRKGVAPASPTELTVVLGTRGSRTWLLLGTGNQSALNSMAHGAGRRMTRAEALGKMKAKHRRESLERTRYGGRVLCDRNELLFEEHPDVYKSVETVVDALVEAGLAIKVAALEPIITVKR